MADASFRGEANRKDFETKYVQAFIAAKRYRKRDVCHRDQVNVIAILTNGRTIR